MSVDCAVGVDVAILGAVKPEVEPLLPLLSQARVFSFRGEVLHLGTHEDRSVLIGTTGLGKVNAAITAAAILETFGAGEVWNVGCAGAYENGPLRIGDVLISQEAICGDEGILSRKGIESPRTIGIPLLTHQGQALYETFPIAAGSWAYDRALRLTPPGLYRVDGGRLRFLGSGLEDGDGHGGNGAEVFRTVHGPSLTISLVSGDRKTAGKRRERYGGLAEDMEGSAIAQTCLRYEIPFLECRAMSNVAGNRDRRDWKLELAFERCCAVVRHWLEGGR
ncbi:MAG: hypothetical protein MUF52_01735 [Syntrophobacteraceae bacterium]|jgi:futalosine hydrolase|nr:hypothetical protein [Syntrophobacteraceae bacterium]